MSQANKEVSNALFQAYISKEPIEFVSKTYNLTEPEAYKTQDDLIHQIQAEKNVPVKGYKVSMTSVATQAIANTNEPAYGTIFISSSRRKRSWCVLQRYLHHYWSLKLFSN